jgi:hypothetical protein
MHAFDRPDIGPREFLLAIMCDPSVDPYLRIDAATKLQRYFLNSNPEFPQDKRPLTYVPPPRSKARRSRSKERELISRNDWLYLKYARDTDAAALRLRDRVLVRNPTFTDNATGSMSSQSNYGGPSA